MADRLQFGFNLQTAGTPGARRLAPDAPMRILLVGDFSGRGERGLDDVASIATRPIVRVDLDNVDQVLKRLTPTVRVELAGMPLELSLATLDDFHPDRLLRQLELFRSLRELRARLQDPATFAAAAAELAAAGHVAATPPGASAASPAAPVAHGESDADVVERLLGRTSGTGPGAPPSTGAPSATPGVDAFVRALIAPHVVADTTSAQRSQATAALDQAMGERLRSVLHAPAFQALEANWRGLRWLLDNLELDDELQVHLLDLTRAELLADARAMHADPATSLLRPRLTDGPAAGAGGAHWSVCVALFDVGASDDDLTWLSALGAIGALAGAPTLATARPSLLGVERIDRLPDPRDWPRLSGPGAAYWQALRHSDLAPWIGLAAPRLLMRQPYGAATDPIDDIAFEEFSGPPEHAQLLWAPAALGCALLLGRAFGQNRWQMQPGDVLQITGLPAYVVDRDGERQLQPCAEVMMSERAALAISERGIMALASYRDRAEARLVRFQSVAEPARALSGPWS